MAQALIYTSVMKGLKTGSKGFCTVASTQGMAKNLGDRLEGLSGYRHLFSPGDPNASKNPVKFSHVIFRIAGVRYNALSRVADCGLDYSQRTNKIAHHIALEGAELSPAGPAWLLAKPGVMETAWQGDPRQLPPPSFPTAAVNAGICHTWKKLAGDAGWGGVLAEATLNKKTIYIVFRPGMDVLPAIQEAVALLPANKRWEATFTTYYQKMPAGVECNWRCVVEGSDEARRALRDPRMIAIDLCAAGTAAPEGPWVDAARTGRTPELGKETHLDWNRAARPGPAPIEVGTETSPVDTSAGPPPDLVTEPPEVPFLDPAHGDFVSTPAGTPVPVFRAKAKSNNLKLVIGASVLFLVSALLFLAFPDKGWEVVAMISGGETKESPETKGNDEAGKGHQADGTHNTDDVLRRSGNGGNGKPDENTQNSEKDDSQGEGTTDTSNGENDTGNQTTTGGDNKSSVNPVTPQPTASKGTPLDKVPHELAFATEKRGKKEAIRLTGIDVDVLKVFPLDSEEPVGFDVHELKVSLLCPVLDPPESGKQLDETPFHLVETGSADSGKKWNLKWRLDDSVDTIGTLEFTKLDESGRQLEFHWNDKIKDKQLSSQKQEIQMSIFELLQGCIVQLSRGEQHRNVFFSLRDPKPGNASDFAVERLFTDKARVILSTGILPLQGDHVRAKFSNIKLNSPAIKDLKPELMVKLPEGNQVTMTWGKIKEDIASNESKYRFPFTAKLQNNPADKFVKPVLMEMASANVVFTLNCRSDKSMLHVDVEAQVLLANPYQGYEKYAGSQIDIFGGDDGSQWVTNGEKMAATNFSMLSKSVGAIFTKQVKDQLGHLENTQMDQINAVDPPLKAATKKTHAKQLDLCKRLWNFWLARQTLKAFLKSEQPKVFAKSPVIVLEREYLDSASGDPAQPDPWIEITRTTWLTP